MTPHKIASREECQAARDELLRRRRNTPNGRRARPATPRAAVGAGRKGLPVETDEGTRTLAELFDDRSQPLVYHSMFRPTYEAGCPTSSSIADTIDAALPHVQARDATIVCVSRASLEKLQTYKRRMGWSFPWASSAGTDCNFDFGVSYTAEQLPSVWGSFLDGEPPPTLRPMAATTGTDVLASQPRAKGARRRRLPPAVDPTARRVRLGGGGGGAVTAHTLLPAVMGHCSRLTSCFAGVSERPGRARSRFRNGRGPGVWRRAIRGPAAPASVQGNSDGLTAPIHARGNCRRASLYGQRAAAIVDGAA
jgi:predicted dithiol-disulfide oxidoreductase (DUF899 family)